MPSINEGADIDELKVKTIYVEQGTTLKRFTARAKGRGNRISKPTCHIYVRQLKARQEDYGTKNSSDRFSAACDP